VDDDADAVIGSFAETEKLHGCPFR
jgi:hypothetical protein